MSRDKNDNNQIPLNIVGMIVFIGFLAVLGIIATTILKRYQDDNQMHAYVLGEADSYGYIGVKITYDVEPVDVQLYAPDGQKFTPDMGNTYYETDAEAHTVTLLADSDKLGIWSAEFNVKDNRKIDYCLVQAPSDTLYMDQPILYVGDDDNYHVKFSTSMSSADHDTTRCSIMLNKTGFSYCVSDVTIPLNEEVDIPLTFPDHVFTDEDYTLEINVFSDTGTSPAQQTINIHIDKRTIKTPAENDENTLKEEVEED